MLIMELIGMLMSVISLWLIVWAIAERIGKICGNEAYTTVFLLGTGIGYILPPVFYFLLGLL